ncbi:unnamed protein product, partial [marine sediment metagenome]
EDLDLWRRLAKYSVNVGIINEPMYIYRKRENSLTTEKSAQKLIGQFNLAKKYKSDIMSKKYLREHYAEILWDLARQAFYIKANFSFIFKCLIQSQVYSPSLFRMLKSFRSVNKAIFKKCYQK